MLQHTRTRDESTSTTETSDFGENTREVSGTSIGRHKSRLLHPVRISFWSSEDSMIAKTKDTILCPPSKNSVAIWPQGIVEPRRGYMNLLIDHDSGFMRIV